MKGCVLKIINYSSKLQKSIQTSYQNIIANGEIDDIGMLGDREKKK